MNKKEPANTNELHNKIQNLKNYMICFKNLQAFRLLCVHHMPCDEYKKRILAAYPESVFMINEIETRGNFE